MNICSAKSQHVITKEQLQDCHKVNKATLLAQDGSLLTPQYDAAATIYDNLVSLIDEGIRNLNTSDAGNTAMAGDDLVYGGNLGSWEQFGNSLKLRLLMRL